MNFIKFLIEFFQSPRTIGAVAPSSKRLTSKIIGNIEFKNAKCIVEYGPGTGVFTDKIVEYKKLDTLLILMECNKNFCKRLEERYAEIDNIFVINDSAENIYKYLEKYHIKSVDYVVSGLPFACLSSNVSDDVLKITSTILGNEGLFITFQYTLLKKKFIGSYFKKMEIERVVLNVPPAYVFKCQNPY